MNNILLLFLYELQEVYQRKLAVNETSLVGNSYFWFSNNSNDIIVYIYDTNKFYTVINRDLKDNNLKDKTAFNRNRKTWFEDLEMRPVVSLYILNANGHLNHQHELPSALYVEKYILCLKRSLELWLSSLKIKKNFAHENFASLKRNWAQFILCVGMFIIVIWLLEGCGNMDYNEKCWKSERNQPLHIENNVDYYQNCWKSELTPSYWQTLCGNVYRRNKDFEGCGNAFGILSIKIEEIWTEPTPSYWQTGSNSLWETAKLCT